MKKYNDFIQEVRIRKDEVELNEMKWEVGGVYHQEFNNGDRVYFKAVSVQKNKKWKGLKVEEFDGRQKKAKNASADETLQFWEVTPDKDIPKGLKESVEIDEKFAGWIAFYGGKQLEIKKSEADGIYPAKQLAIKHFKVPKSKLGLLAIEPAHESVTEGWKKGKYTIKDNKDKILGTYNSGGKAQKAMDDLMQTGDYERLTVELIKNVNEDEINEDKETATAIRKLIKKEFGLGPKDVSVKSSHGGTSSSVNVNIKTIKATKYISKIDDLTNSLERYDMDDRTGEILSGGNTFIFTKMDWNLRNKLTDNIQKEYMKVANGGLALSEQIVLYGIFQVTHTRTNRFEVLNKKTHKTFTSYLEQDVGSAVFSSVVDDNMYSKFE